MTYMARNGWRATRRIDGKRFYARGQSPQEAEERLEEKLSLDSVPVNHPITPVNVVSDEDYEALWNVTEKLVEAERNTDRDVTKVDWDFGDKPVGILLPSDFHIGSKWTNYKQLRSDIEYLGNWRSQHPGALHLVHLGDLTDNYFAAGKHPSGMHESVVMRTDKQRELAIWLISQAGNWLALLLGCHLAWNLTQIGEDVLQPIADAVGAVNAGYGLDATVTVGDQVYRLLMRHKGKSEGSGNLAASLRTLDAEYGTDGDKYDAICLSHRHTSDLQISQRAGRKVVYTRSGGFKGGDCFARAGGYTNNKSADCGIPLLILDSKKHDIQAFDGHHWKQGLDTLLLARGES